MHSRTMFEKVPGMLLTTRFHRRLAYGGKKSRSLCRRWKLDRTHILQMCSETLREWGFVDEARVLERGFLPRAGENTPRREPLSAAFCAARKKRSQVGVPPDARFRTSDVLAIDPKSGLVV